jgi:NhaP-type Na+/H+ or K+/H+ antiporter
MDQPSPERVMMRRAPRARSFVLLGMGGGVIAVLAVSSMFSPDPALGAGLVAGYFLLWGVVVGLVVGLLAWLIADRVSKRQATEVIVERLGPDSVNEDSS